MRHLWIVLSFCLALAACDTRHDESWLAENTPQLTAGLSQFTDIIPTDSAVTANRTHLTEQLNRLTAMDTTGWDIANQIRWGASVVAHQAALSKLDAMHHNPIAYSPRPSLESALKQCGDARTCPTARALVEGIPARYQQAQAELSTGISTAQWQAGIVEHIALYGWLDSLCATQSEWACDAPKRAIKAFIGYQESRKQEQSLEAMPNTLAQ